MTVFVRSGAASRLALAVALATGTAIAFAGPAQAAKKEAKPEAPKANYTKGFVAVYQPFAAKLKAGGDLTPLKAELAAVTAAAQSTDDKYAAGQIAYSLGSQIKDPALQRQGVAMMVDSNSTLVGDERGKLTYALAQMAYQAKDWANVQTRAKQAIDLGYGDDAYILMSEAYFSQDQAAPGLQILDQAIAAKTAANQSIPETWIKRAVAMSYKAKLADQAARYAGMYAQYYPSVTSWGDAIAIQRNLVDYDPQELLDLMRLADRAKALRDERDYIEYISAADARRLPGETQRIIAQGIAAGKLKANDVLVAEASTLANGRVKADMADLTTLTRDARADGAKLVTVMAAADSSLGYGKAADAEALYTKALTMPGVDAGRALTRLGIAQLEQGKSAEAQASFAKVTGQRKPIAELWTIYAKQGATPAAAPAA